VDHLIKTVIHTGQISTAVLFRVFALSNTKNYHFYHFNTKDKTLLVVLTDKIEKPLNNIRLFINLS